MVGELVALKVRLLAGGLRRSTMRTIGFVLGALVLLGGGVAGAVGLAATRSVAAADAGLVTTAVLGVVALQWLIVPVLATGVDETLDPARFALLPLRARQLLPGLVVSSFVGPAGVAQLLLTTGFVVAWARGIVPLALALVFGLVGALTAVCTTRALATALAAASGGRRWRDITSMVAVLLSTTMGLWFNLLGTQLTSVERARSIGAQVAGVLSWTPLGAAWAVPWDAATGRWALALAHGALALVFLVGLLWWWRRSLDERLVSPPSAGLEGTAVRASSWYDRYLPDTPVGAVMQRALRYWTRDPRYLMSLGMALLIPVIMVAPGLMSAGSEGVSRGEMGVLAFTGLATAWASSVATMQDTSYDGSAFSLHVLSGMTGRADRWGRALPVLAWALPMSLLVTSIGCAVSGQWRFWPLAAALVLAMLGAGIGAAQWTSAQWQFPAPPPGASQMTSPPGSTVATLAALACCTIAQALVCLPMLVLGVALHDHALARWACLLLGALLGAGALVLGVRVGGAVLDRSWPEVLGRVTERAG